MDTRLLALAGGQNGAFSARQAHQLGVCDVELRRATAAKELVRVRRGAYVDGSTWGSAGADERYRLGVLAVARSRPGDVVSHHAALALHGLPLWKHAADRVDLMGDVRQAVRRAGIFLHPRGIVEPTVVDGVLVVPIAPALVRSALTMGGECAVIAGDFALHHGLVTLDELYAEVALVTVHEGRGRALEAVLSMDPKSESVGESRTRLVFDHLGMAYESQYVIRDDAGSFVARVDFLVEGVVAEFDGKEKYLRGVEVADTDAAAQVVWLEKRREDSIRRRGYPVERFIWSDLERPGLIGARVRAARP